jgi:hypothetical protein
MAHYTLDFNPRIDAASPSLPLSRACGLDPFSGSEIWGAGRAALSLGKKGLIH